MKKKIIKFKISCIALFLAINIFTYGQVRIANSAINTAAANSSAFIDASSNTAYNQTTNIGKGFLYPRTDLTTFTQFSGLPVGVPNSYPNFYDGFMVYNTASSGVAGVGATLGTLTVGYWYYDNKSSTINGGTWKPISTTVSPPSNTGWALNGNSTTASNFLGTINAQPLRLVTSNVERMQITPTGRVGVGVTAPGATWHVKNTESGALGTTLRLTSPAGFDTDLTASNANFLMILPTPSSASLSAFALTRPGTFYDLVMNGNGNWAIGGGVDNTYKFRIWGSMAATGFFNTSDIRLKKNIKAVENGMDIVNKLRPVSYEKKNMINDATYDHSEIGFIAQEVQKVLPQVIVENSDEHKTLSMNYISLIPVLTKAIQELNEKIIKLQNKMNELERKEAGPN